MDDIGAAGQAFLLVASAAGLLLFVALPLWASIDLYRSRRRFPNLWLPFAAALLISMPFLVGGLLAVIYLVFIRQRVDKHAEG